MYQFKKDISAILSEPYIVPLCLFYVILDKPICGNLHRKVQGVAQGKSTDIICPILAHPPPKSFIWKFNNSIEALEVTLEDVYSFIKEQK